MGTQDFAPVQRLGREPVGTRSVADFRRGTCDAASRRPRDRVTVDLRGIGSRLQGHASAQGKSVAAMVRVAVVAMLDSSDCVTALPCSPGPIESRTVKVTLRVGAMHAARLAHRARAAEVSQGAYVATLLDGMAASPRPADHGDAVAALAESTQRVAAMSADINTFTRLIRDLNLHEAPKFCTGLMSLSEDMRLHLRVASRLMARMTTRTREASGPP